jgi:hypothetical protein
MGIEPKRTARLSLSNTTFHEALLAARDRHANFSDMRDNVGLGETIPPFAIEFPLSTPAVRDDRVLQEPQSNWWFYVTTLLLPSSRA